VAKSDIPKIEHQPDIALDIPERELPSDYRELAEAAMAIVPWLDGFGEETHPIAEQYREARFKVEKSREHAERYFMLKERRDAAIKRFRKALETLQVIADR
jgi:hypothetical protein